MSQIIRKVTFDTDGAPSPRILAVGMQGDNNARLIRFAVPELTEGQQVYVNAELGEVKDTIRLYEDDEGLYGWSVEQSLLRSFGNGTVQVKVFDALDPLKPKWQSGQIHISVGASMDVDADVSAQYPTAIEQMEARFQEVEAATLANAQAAQDAQTGAENARDAATASAEAAQTAQTAAEAARDEAAALEKNAQDAAKAAKNSAGEASTSASNAQSYANRTVTNANRAESARKAAEAAKADLEAARDAAAVSAEAAQTAQTAAEAAKTDLEAARDAAAESAAQAGNHATAANSARNAAQASATAAADEVNEAKNAQTASTESASQAGQHATAAQNAKTAAETAQANAEDARDVAKNRAADAAASATAAANSAEAAQQAATDAQQIIDDTQVSAAKTWSSNGVLEHLTIQFAESGNPATCYPVGGSALGAAVTIAPHQAGEGDASPSNIRAITVPTTATVKRIRNLYDPVKYPMTYNKYVNGSSGGIVASVSGKYAGTETGIPIADYRGAKILYLSAGGNEPGIAFYDADDAFVAGVRNSNKAAGSVMSVTVPDTAETMRITALWTQWQQAWVCADADYAEYTLTLPDGFGGGEVDLAAGTVTQTWGQFILRGDEGWTNYNGTPNLVVDALKSAVSDGAYVPKSAIMSSHFPYDRAFAGYMVIHPNTGRIYIGAKTVDAVGGYEGWITYITEQYAAGTPVTICYKLAAPVTTAIPAQPIPALAGQNTLLTDADGLTVSGYEDPAHTRAALQAQIDELKTAMIAIGGK